MRPVCRSIPAQQPVVRGRKGEREGDARGDSKGNARPAERRGGGGTLRRARRPASSVPRCRGQRNRRRDAWRRARQGRGLAQRPRRAWRTGGAAAAAGVSSPARSAAHQPERSLGAAVNRFGAPNLLLGEGRGMGAGRGNACAGRRQRRARTPAQGLADGRSGGAGGGQLPGALRRARRPARTVPRCRGQQVRRRDAW